MSVVPTQAMSPAWRSRVQKKKKKNKEQRTKNEGDKRVANNVLGVGV
jgi:hypothetical protein